MVFFLLTLPAQAETPTIEKQPEPLTIEEKIEHYATAYNVNPDTMHKVIKCESNYNPNAWNKSDPLGGAKGIGQFLQPTFDHYSKEAGAEPDIWNVDAQLQTMAYMFSIGEAKQWTCYRKLTT